MYQSIIGGIRYIVPLCMVIAMMLCLAAPF